MVAPSFYRKVCLGSTAQQLKLSHILSRCQLEEVKALESSDARRIPDKKTGIFMPVF